MRDSRLSQRHLLGIKNITSKDIELIFETADFFKDLINRR
jgi:aspartate carbamoyltransferase catalytic subunit